jgi:hypothetical protein
MDFIVFEGQGGLKPGTYILATTPPYLIMQVSYFFTADALKIKQYKEKTKHFAKVKGMHVYIRPVYPLTKEIPIDNLILSEAAQHYYQNFLQKKLENPKSYLHKMLG